MPDTLLAWYMIGAKMFTDVREITGENCEMHNKEMSMSNGNDVLLTASSY